MGAVEVQHVADMCARNIEVGPFRTAIEKHAATRVQPIEVEIAANIGPHHRQAAAYPDRRHRDALLDDDVAHQDGTVDLGSLKVEMILEPRTVETQRSRAAQGQHVESPVEA